MSSPAQEAVAWLNEYVAFSDVAASHGRPDCVSMQDHPLSAHAKPLQLPSARINDPSIAQRLVTIGKGKNT